MISFITRDLSSKIHPETFLKPPQIASKLRNIVLVTFASFPSICCCFSLRFSKPLQPHNRRQIPLSFTIFPRKNSTPLITCNCRQSLTSHPKPQNTFSRFVIIPRLPPTTLSSGTSLPHLAPFWYDFREANVTVIIFRTSKYISICTSLMYNMLFVRKLSREWKVTSETLLSWKDDGMVGNGMFVRFHFNIHFCSLLCVSLITRE